MKLFQYFTSTETEFYSIATQFIYLEIYFIQRSYQERSLSVSIDAYQLLSGYHAWFATPATDSITP